MFDGGIEEFFYLGEIDDLVELPFYLGPAHAKDRPVEEYVLPAGEFWMEAGTDLEKARHPPPNPDRT